MFSKTVKQYVSILMLLMVSVSMTSSTIGEFRSHSLSSFSMNAEHSHSHEHHHAVDDEHRFKHDSSNHNHTYDSAHLRAIQANSIDIAADLPIAEPSSGNPNYRPFLIERPPRVRLFI